MLNSRHAQQHCFRLWMIMFAGWCFSALWLGCSTRCCGRQRPMNKAEPLQLQHVHRTPGEEMRERRVDVMLAVHGMPQAGLSP